MKNAAILALLCMSCGNSREDRAHRMDANCDYVRLLLTDARAHILSNEKTHWRWAAGAVSRIQQDDWHEVNLCAPESMPVGRDMCDLTQPDRVCLLHEIDWALAWTR